MTLLDVFMLWDAGSDGVEERFDVYEAACALGQAAFASDHQLFILTAVPFEDAARRLQAVRPGEDFLKIVEVAGRFVLTGAYPDAVHDLIERAGADGAVALDWSKRPDAMPTAAPEPAAGVWLH